VYEMMQIVEERQYYILIYVFVWLV